MNAPEISIVVANYNGKDLLKILLNSISKSSYKNHEIIVVDNNSSDGSVQFLKKNFRKVKIAQNKKNLGYSGINSAIKYCKGKYILFLNNDMELQENCIGNMLEIMGSDDAIAMVAPRLVNYYDKTLKSGGTWVSRAFYNGHLQDNGKTATEIPYLGVGLIKKDFVDAFGYLFDPDYFIYAEDLDLGLRIRLCGKKIIFAPDAILYHMHSVSMLRRKTFSTYLMERNILTTFFKILSSKNIILFFPYVVFARFAALAKDILTLKISCAFARLRAVVFVFFNFRMIMKKRHETQKFRKVGDDFILKVFTERYLFKKKFLI